MRRFEPVADEGTGSDTTVWEAIIEPEEAALLATLARQLQVLLAESLEPGADADPALRALLPDPYRHDPELADEWRRLSRRGLVERKTGFARTLAELVDPIANAENAQPVRVTADQALDWVRGIGSLRLVVAERLGVVDDEEPFGSAGENLSMLAEVYSFLGWVQDDLVRVLEQADDVRQS